jgi:starvation-inducible DNA-binding protein
MHLGMTKHALEHHEKIAAELQPVLADLIDLSLQGKQAHWNVTGPFFQSVHEQMDKIVDDTRGWADEVAERMMAMGATASGQVDDVANASSLDPLPKGTLDDQHALALVAQRVQTVASRTRAAMERLGDIDLVSQDLIIAIVAGLEKHLWMLRAQIRA